MVIHPRPVTLLIKRYKIEPNRARAIKTRARHQIPLAHEYIDTETPTGRAMWQMIGLLAELERSLITERTRAGAAAKRRGVKFGRKSKLICNSLPMPASC